MEKITSLSSQQIKDTVKLQQKKYRAESGLFLLEGYKPIFEANESSIEIKTLFTTEKFLSKFEFLKDKTILVNEAVLEKISTTDSMPEAVAVAKQPDYKIASEFKRIALIENIKDAGNLGTIIRSAAAFGIESIVLSGDSVDIFNPKVVRSAVGALFKVPVVKIDDLKKFKNDFPKHKFIATIVNSKDIINPENVNYSEPFVLMFGSESDGLSDESMEMADIKTTIPMTNKAESLNLSVAASIMFYMSAKKRDL